MASKPNAVQQSVRKSLRDWINDINGQKPEKVVNQPAQGTENWYRDRLAQQLNGKTEVTTPVGRIDILTKTEIIEIKSSKNWKNAIGQVKAYGQYHPDRRLRIHLFGQITERKLKNIQTICDSNAILLTWE
jgi:hypothetical protein